MRQARDAEEGQIMPDIIPGLSVQLPSALDVMSVITTFTTLVIFIGAIGLVAWFLTRNRKLGKFPVIVDIFQVKNGNLQWVEADRARRRKKKDGEEYYEFKKRNVKLPAPTFEGLVNGPRGVSRLFLKELSHDEFEVIDPKSFITGKPDDYEKIEVEHNVRFWKNLEENKAHFKWNKENKWDKLINALPIVLSLFGLGLFFYFFGTYVLVPTLGAAGQGQQLLEQSMSLLDKSTQYVELILRANGYNMTAANGTVIIP